MFIARSKYFRATLFSSIVAILAATAQAQNFNSTRGDDMPVFAPAGEHFSVRFPGKPERLLETGVIQYSVAKNGQFFGMAIENSSEIARLTAENALTVEVEDFAKAFKGQVVSKTKTINGNEGQIKAVIESEDAQALVAAYRMDGRTFTVAFAMRKGDNYPADAYTFLNSFKVIK